MRKKFVTQVAYVIICTFILQGTGLLLYPARAYAQEATPPTKPNIILINVDNMGWGDLCKNYPGNPNCFDVNYNKNLNKLASEGVTLSNFYTPVPICSPSRAALMTGQDPRRYEIYSALPDAGKAQSDFLPNAAITLAEALPIIYDTAIIGKWHLGWADAVKCPTRDCNSWDQGFEHNYVLPLGIAQQSDGFCLATRYRGATTTTWSYIYDILPNFGSNQSDAIEECKNAPYKNTFIKAFRSRSLTQEFTSAALNYIKYPGDSIKGTRDKNNPFFLYLAYPVPHAPLYIHLPQTPQIDPTQISRKIASLNCQQSLCTPKEVHDACETTCYDAYTYYDVNCIRNCEIDIIYPSVIKEIDNNIGQILDYIDAPTTLDPRTNAPLKNSTIVMFTSDNGPYIGDAAEYWNLRSNSTGGLRGGQKFNYEGGVRVPFIARWPNHWPSGAAGGNLSQPADMMDILPTLVTAAHGTVPTGLNGNDISAVLSSGDTVQRTKDIQTYWWYAYYICLDWYDSDPKIWNPKGYCSVGPSVQNFQYTVRSYSNPPANSDLNNYKLHIESALQPRKLYNISTNKEENDCTYSACDANSEMGNLCWEFPHLANKGEGYCINCCTVDKTTIPNTITCHATTESTTDACKASTGDPTLWNENYRYKVKTLWEKTYNYLK